MISKCQIAALIAGFAALPLFAQLGMELKSNQSTYMLHEPVFLQVGIRNDSGQPLVFGDRDNLRGRLFLEMTDSAELNSRLSQGNMVSGEFPLFGRVIRPGEISRLVLRFDGVMKLDKPGFYRVHAYATHPMLKDAFRSNEIKVELSRGAVMRSFPVGVPQLVVSDGEKIASRTYTLRSLIDGGSRYFYIVLEDENKVYQVVRIGTDLGIAPPRCEIDMLNRLHVLLNISAKVFKYYIIDISGKIESCTYSKISNTIPTLVRDPSGRVYVAGGEPAVEGVDYTVENVTIRAAGE